MKLVSVCIVTYNQESYIEDAIKGVLMQKECDFEIVIADDHSTDRTFEICQKYQLERPDIITLIRQPENKGVVMNTRDCLLACSGKYIAICEGDDYWIDKYKLKKQVEILEKDDNISMVHTSWINYQENSNNFCKRLTTTQADKSFIAEIKEGPVSVLSIMKGEYRGIRFSSICFRNSAFHTALECDNNLFSPKYSTCDLVLFYMLANYGKFSYISDETTVYRIISDSVSNNQNKDKAAHYTLGILYIKAHFMNVYHLPISELNKSLQGLFYLPMNHAFNTKDKQLAKEVMTIAKIIKYRPTIGQRLKYRLILFLFPS